MQVLVAKEKDRSSYRIRFSPDEKAQLDVVLEAIGGPQFVCERLIRWFSDQPDEVRLMVIGSLPATADLVEVVIRRLAAEQNARKRSGGTGHGVKLMKAASNKKDLE